MLRTAFLAAVVAGSVAGAQAPPASPPIDSATNAFLERADRGRMQGDPNARVWLVEVSDFQCPFCKMWHDSTYEAVRREFIAPGLVRMAYVNFPVGGHRYAVVAAEAAMCASAQDKFWPMHDRIFDTQTRWSPIKDSVRVVALFDSLARASGVNMVDWRACVANRSTRRLVAADRDRGDRAGVRGTPYFFIGDEAINGAAPYDAIRNAILRAAAKSQPRRP